MAKVVVVVLGAVAALGLGWAIAEGPLRDPEDALRDFYDARGRAEDQLLDPLILNGGRVVPLVIAELPDRQMRLRRYAIAFLGNGRYRDALPVLERILSDESEAAVVRAVALGAIFGIAPDREGQVAREYRTGEGPLGPTAREIVAGRDPVRWTRSYLQAFLHVHD